MIDTESRSKTMLKQLVFWFILLQPFLDVYFFYQPPLSKMFVFSIPTMIRILFIAVIGVLYLVAFRQNRWNWFLFGYAALLAIYSGLHLYFTKGLYTLDPHSIGFSVPGELFYLVRMALPLIMLWVTAQLHVTKDQLTKIFTILTWITSGSIVISNLFVFSLASYGEGPQAAWIKGSIFSWFDPNNNLSFLDLASKGFFYYANATSAIEVLFAFFVIYRIFKHIDWQSVALLITQIFAMFMLGTKTATYGLFIAFVAVLAIFTILPLLQGQGWQGHWHMLTIAAIFCVFFSLLFYYSPNRHRTDGDDYAIEVRAKEVKKVQKKDKRVFQEVKKLNLQANRPALVNFIGKYYPYFGLHPRFVKDGYSYKVDPNFWLTVMTKWTPADRFNHRKLERAILDRIRHVANSSKTNWFGISYTRMNTAFNLERDFLSQWYSLGLIGVLLFLGPYIYSMLWLAVAYLRRFRRITQFEASIYAGVAAVLAISWYSGNVLDFLMESLILCFTIGVLWGLQLSPDEYLPNSLSIPIQR
jgi:hypothetical protein